MPILLDAPVVAITKDNNFFEKFFLKDYLGSKKTLFNFFLDRNVANGHYFHNITLALV